MFSSEYIHIILYRIHPDKKITLESVNILQQLFCKFGDLTFAEIIKLIPENSQLYNFTLTIANKFNNEYYKKTNIIEFFLSEILELSGNCARDNKIMIITANCIWMAIFNDDELIELFKDNLPSIGPYHRINDKIYHKYGSICKYNLNKIKELLIINNIKYEPIIIKKIQYILNYFINLCVSYEELIQY